MHLVVLCGGTGSRLWPLSRSEEPKQFLRLLENASLLEQALSRVAAYAIGAPPVVVCGREHVSFVRAQMERCGIAARIVVEPVRRNTAAAIAAAAELLVEDDPDALMLVTPADHFIADPEHLGAVLAPAAELAGKGGIVTFGIKPRNANAGYGYIELGDDAFGPARRVRRFVEKPAQEMAEEFVRSKRFVWNSGIFLFRAQNFLSELRANEPAIASAAAAAVKKARRQGDVVELDAESFSASPDKSVDYAIMERTKNAFVVPVELQWSDLGSWDALWEVMEKDEGGNASHGDVVAVDCRDTLLRSDGRLVAAVGVENLVVVDTPDAVLVARLDRPQDIKALVDRLRVNRRTEADTPAIVLRPWGSYQTICETSHYKVKRIFINPAAAISLQFHHKRSEHWTIVSGSGLLTLGSEQRPLARGDTAFIPVAAHHRLRNTGGELLEFIEVQLGEYLGEDDIVRLSDDYGRAP